VIVFAHRGASWDAPENTLEAFELAVDQGADYVEFDVRIGADGTLVIHHDAIPSDPPPGMPTLDATLATLRGRVGLAVDLKEAEAVPRTLAALQARRVPAEDVVLLSTRTRDLRQAQRARPDFRYVLHLGRRPDPTAATSFWGVTFKDRFARPRQLALSLSLGLVTTVWTVNDPARMEELARLGVDGLFTDRPAFLRDVLGRTEARAPGQSRGGSR
jgi:glycerophosphoryl diester phosphodiesterase